MQIEIAIGGDRLTATLEDSAAAGDLLDQLPVTVEMVDHGGVEKTGSLVLYYGDQSYFPGIVVLGHLDGEAAGRIAALEGSVTATVEAR